MDIDGFHVHVIETQSLNHEVEILCSLREIFVTCDIVFGKCVPV